MARYSLSNMALVTLAVLLPIVAILFAAWYLGFIFSSVEVYNDPCLRFYNERNCVAKKECRWNKKRKICGLDSDCMGAGQQNCGEGCHWDATVKKPGSNLYGLCRPATLAKIGQTGTMEVK